jgi:hypothetical protein
LAEDPHFLAMACHIREEVPILPKWTDLLAAGSLIKLFSSLLMFRKIS